MRNYFIRWSRYTALALGVGYGLAAILHSILDKAGDTAYQYYSIMSALFLVLTYTIDSRDRSGR